MTSGILSGCRAIKPFRTKTEELFMKKLRNNKTKKIKRGRVRKDVVAFRLSCDVKGTGLSHYILMEKKGDK
jgi:modified peptide precursor CbpA